MHPFDPDCLPLLAVVVNALGQGPHFFVAFCLKLWYNASTLTRRFQETNE